MLKYYDLFKSGRNDHNYIDYRRISLEKHFYLYLLSPFQFHFQKIYYISFFFLNILGKVKRYYFFYLIILLYLILVKALFSIVFYLFLEY